MSRIVIILTVVVWKCTQLFDLGFCDKRIWYMCPIAVQQAGGYYPVSRFVFFWQFVGDSTVWIKLPENFNFDYQRKNDSAVFPFLYKLAVFVFNFILSNIDPS